MLEEITCETEVNRAAKRGPGCRRAHVPTCPWQLSIPSEQPTLPHRTTTKHKDAHRPQTPPQNY